jgi:hypothetical protein
MIRLWTPVNQFYFQVRLLVIPLAETGELGGPSVSRGAESGRPTGTLTCTPGTARQGIKTKITPLVDLELINVRINECPSGH